ncbi:FAD-binding oxidoreductase (plasmid) [Chromobacterium amazonense]|nr:FAD-binding oxidoreductase [Chromobacterium amazonense]MDE1712381.1 FAD-binding oxidoreductase [Chromobacterium amazonense]
MRRRNALALRWTLREYSPFTLATGAWPQPAPARQWLPLRVNQVEDENDAVRSIYLEPADGSPPLPFLPGQHLSLKVMGVDGARLRNYTLSQTGGYRISVKRQGKASARLHQLAPGDIVEALRRPAVHLHSLPRRPQAAVAVRHRRRHRLRKPDHGLDSMVHRA